MELAQLSRIFEDKSIEELQIILLRYGNNVDAAVEAILNGDDDEVHHGAAVDGRRKMATAQSYSTPAVAATIVALPPPHSQREEDILLTPEIAAEEQEERRRRRTLLEQEAQEQQEEAENLAKALQASKSPSDRGRLGLFSSSTGVILNDDDDDDVTNNISIDELMRDPTFVQAIMEDDDLCAAIRLQKRLDEEEAQQQGDGGRITISPGSLATELPRQSLSPSSIKRILWDPSTQRLAVSEVKTRLQSLIKRAQDKKKQNQPNDTDAQLVEQLEALNRENQEEQFRRQVKRQAEAACLDAIHDHLDRYLLQHPRDASYECWIEELHPENAYDGLLLQEMGKTIDHRFYVESSDHRKIWNERIKQQQGCCNNRAFVPVRVGASKNDTVEDLLSGNHDYSAPASTPTTLKDDLLFGNYATATTPVAALDITPTAQFDPFGILQQSSNNSINNVNQQQTTAMQQQQQSTNTTTPPAALRDDADDEFGEFQNAFVPASPTLFLGAATSKDDGSSTSQSSTTSGPDKHLIVFD